jgi:hypothetical protein
MLEPLEIIASAQRRANDDTGRGFPYILATAILSHVRWYLQHGAAAAPGRSLAGRVCEYPSTFTPIGGYCATVRASSESKYENSSSVRNRNESGFPDRGSR